MILFIPKFRGSGWGAVAYRTESISPYLYLLATARDMCYFQEGKSFHRLMWVTQQHVCWSGVVDPQSHGFSTSVQLVYLMVRQHVLICCEKNNSVFCIFSSSLVSLVWGTCAQATFFLNGLPLHLVQSYESMCSSLRGYTNVGKVLQGQAIALTNHLEAPLLLGEVKSEKSAVVTF